MQQASPRAHFLQRHAYLGTLLLWELSGASNALVSLILVLWHIMADVWY